MVIVGHGQGPQRRVRLRVLGGDHRGGARHVQVFRDSDLLLKWDLDNQKAIEGKPTRRLLGLIDELRKEGRL